MCRELFPATFPAEIADDVFVTGNEVAWSQTTASAAIEWLAAHGYAVLGTELWVVKNGTINSLPRGLSGMGEAHGNVVWRESGETWASFVSRAAAETVAYLRSFNPAEIVEEGEVLFNVTWLNESEFDKLIHR